MVDNTLKRRTLNPSWLLDLTFEEITGHLVDFVANWNRLTYPQLAQSFYVSGKSGAVRITMEFLPGLTKIQAEIAHPESTEGDYEVCWQEFIDDTNHSRASMSAYLASLIINAFKLLRQPSFIPDHYGDW